MTPLLLSLMVHAAPVDEAPKKTGLSFGAAIVAVSPSIELEYAPLEHLSIYVGGDGSALLNGFGAQAGVRLRPTSWLSGPFLDVHLRVSRYQWFGLGSTFEEKPSPGMMLGYTWVERHGLMVSGGLGLSLAVWRTSRELDFSGLLSPTSQKPFEPWAGPLPEARLNVGWAI